MKIFDCTTFFDENLILEVRFNVLNKYVDKFVVAEARYSHSGDKKKLNFDLKRFNEFKEKIIYVVIENEPDDLIFKKENNEFSEAGKDIRNNSIKRIAFQRDSLSKGIEEADDEDFIFYSDNDEIPNLENFDFELNKNKIVMFKQKLFYYKFNLFCDRVDWHGTKGCKKKNLISFTWLRDLKTKKYPFFRLDTFFSKNKYRNVKIVEDGGWHFTQLKTAKDIEIKFLNSEIHGEFKSEKINLKKILGLMERKTIDYDHKANSADYKYANEFKLKTVSIDQMPAFLKMNQNKYYQWFDFDNEK